MNACLEQEFLDPAAVGPGQGQVGQLGFRHPSAIGKTGESPGPKGVEPLGDALV